ncbi:MAG: hypothetical protein PF495_14520, partial [Spirochaetales bacterium]|nr:hypothetical protein [Spirochaetales bacterium]
SYVKGWFGIYVLVEYEFPSSNDDLDYSWRKADAEDITILFKEDITILFKQEPREENDGKDDG